MALEQYDQAIIDCKDAVVARGNAKPSAKLLVRLAKCHLALDDIDSAVKAYREATNFELRSLSASVREAAAPERLLGLLCSANEALSEKDWAKAKEALDTAAEEFEGARLMKCCAWSVEVEIGLGNSLPLTMKPSELSRGFRSRPTP